MRLCFHVYRTVLREVKDQYVKLILRCSRCQFRVAEEYDWSTLNAKPTVKKTTLVNQDGSLPA